jgi:hypothetical protein
MLLLSLNSCRPLPGITTYQPSVAAWKEKKTSKTVASVVEDEGGAQVEAGVTETAAVATAGSFNLEEITIKASHQEYPIFMFSEVH